MSPLASSSKIWAIFEHISVEFSAKTKGSESLNLIEIKMFAIKNLWSTVDEKGIELQL